MEVIKVFSKSSIAPRLVELLSMVLTSAGTALELWTETWTRGLEAKGRPRNIATQNKHRLIEAGSMSILVPDSQ